ncbi:hypothetical protein OAU50_00960 [Planctomycetota bacterium]|nr:hypothetical protein [Planctomycetota bacterium]
MARSGVIDAKTDITKAEIYVLTKDAIDFTESTIKALVEDDYGYGLRSFVVGETKWETYATPDES